ncbi:MAG: HlyC/CorC family transporter [candidate division Zixibacteria bacterium]|nr:HlyC/CorC family transporter [candidate division Zixibacteria bacterium]
MLELLSILVIAGGYISAYIVSLYSLAMYIDPEEVENLFPNLSRRRRELFLKLIDDPRLFVQIAAVYKSFALVMISAVTFFMVERGVEVLGSQRRLLYVGSLLLVWLLYVVVVEYLPRRSSRTAIGPSMLGSLWLIVFIYILFSPLVHLYRRSLARTSVTRQVSEDDKEEIVERAIETLADHAGIGETLVEEEEKEMIGQIFRLDQTTVREIMVPRIDMVAIEKGTGFAAIRELVKRDGHSRYPIYEGTIDKIIGLLYVKDIFNNMPQPGEEFVIDTYLRPPHFVPESKVIGDLLKEFKGTKRHIAIVIDEYGGVAGLITLEDILEEIVGDIQDEHDVEAADMVSTGPREYVVDGGMILDKLLEETGLEYDHADYDTVGGLIYDLVGSVPKQGARVVWHALEFEILRLSGQRIVSVRVRLSAPPVRP